MKPIEPEEIAFSETDGALSINAAAVANRLNELLKAVNDLAERSGRCECMNCIVIGARR